MKHSERLLGKFPIFEYIEVGPEVTLQELAVLEQQIHLTYFQMSNQAKCIWKKVKRISDFKSDKFKANKKLYKRLNRTLMAMGLSINSQNLDSLDPFAEKSFKVLEDLQLNDNFISDIRPLTVSLMPQLQTLQMARNSISSIKVMEEAHWVKLKVLVLSENSITSIESLLIGEFYRIEVIKLSQNSIHSISLLKRRNLDRLRNLDLSYNQISEIYYLRLNSLSLEGNLIPATEGIEKTHFNRHVQSVDIMNSLSTMPKIERIMRSKFARHLNMGLQRKKIRNPIAKREAFLDFS